VLHLRDAARVGAIVGVDGWTRSLNVNHYDWHKDYDGVKLRIVEAEDVMVKPEVKPQDFPLLLADADDSPKVGISSAEDGDIF